jgi:hypothetical protein
VGENGSDFFDKRNRLSKNDVKNRKPHLAKMQNGEEIGKTA